MFCGFFMKKEYFFGFLTAFLLLSLSFSSAYPYYGNYGNNYYPNNQFDTYSYSSTRSYGDSFGLSYQKITNYNKLNEVRYLRDGSIERTTSYVRTVRETPDYRYPNYYGNSYYGNSYYGNYGMGYGGSYYQGYIPRYNLFGY